MGTTFSIKVVAPPDTLSMAALRSEVEQALRDLENLASTYIEHSELSRFNSTLSTDWIDVLTRAFLRPVITSTGALVAQ